MQAELTTSVTAIVERIRFEKNGFVILAIYDEKNKKTMGAKGTIIGSAKNLIDQTVVFEGVIVDTEYGEQIDFTHCAIEEGVNYFWQKVAKITKKAQDFIQARHGSNPNWLNGDPLLVTKDLCDVPGIKQKTAAKVLDRWADYQSIKQLMELVSSYGIPQSQAVLIHRHFAEKSVDIILNAPYRLTEVKGIGFRKADEVARRIGIAEDAIDRIIAAMSFAMSEINDNGSTCVHMDTFIDKVNELVTLSEEDKVVINTYEELEELLHYAAQSLKNPPMFVSDVMISLKSFYSMDRYIKRIIDLNEHCTAVKVSLEKALKLVENREDFAKLGEQQKEAVMNVLTKSGIIIISGYAGTGKTTTSKTALNILAKAIGLGYDDIVGCALSGVAANRIKNQSGYEASTIHSLLGTSETGGWIFNQDNKLPQSVVVLDEAGMVDTHLFFSLLKAIDFERTKLIVMGDPAQLPPVGAGQPFIDLIESDIVPHTQLTKIYRQSEDKAIAFVASQIRIGKRPSIRKEYTDVFSYKAVGETNIEINQSIEDQLLTLSERFKMPAPSLDDMQSVVDYLYSYQVITPRRTSVLGQETLSAKVRDILLPATKKSVCSDILPVSVYDKMIHLKNQTMSTVNDKQVRVYNGMVGIVESIDVDADEFVVYYPLDRIRVKYTEKHLNAGVISYAWALTIHKTQGSEYKNIAIPFSRSHWSMLSSKLTYTAITRAKESCHLIGDLGAFTHACTNLESTMRDTVFQQLMAA